MMKLLRKLFSNRLTGPENTFKRNRNSYIFYKIVNCINHDTYTLQCINTSATFKAKIADIVFDTDLLHGLHPTQACYMGIQYAEYLKKEKIHSIVQTQRKHKLPKYAVSRYGKYVLCYQDRLGNLCFVDQTSNEQVYRDPRDIALNEKMIEQFDAAQAFYIGLSAGLKMNQAKENKPNKPRLRLVK